MIMEELLPIEVYSFPRFRNYKYLMLNIPSMKFKMLLSIKNIKEILLVQARMSL